MKFFYDLRLAVRFVFRHPLLVAVSVLSLTIGITANTTVFSVINSLLFEVPKVDSPKEMVEVYGENPKKSLEMVSYPDFLHYRQYNSVFSGMVAYYLEGVTLNHEGRSRLAFADIVTSNYFSLLGIRPAIGRGFTVTDDTSANVEYAVVFSHKYWETQFGGDPNIAGKTITVNRHRFVVIGVAPKDFAGVQTGLVPDLWLPVATMPEIIPDFDLSDHSARAFTVLARMKPKVKTSEVRAQMQTMAAQLAQSFAKTNQGRSVAIGPISALPPDVKPAIVDSAWFLQIAVSLVLLIVCANVSSLLLARGAGRRREIAIRFALGAHRRDVVRQLLMEPIVMAMMAGVVSIVLTFWITQYIPGLVPPQLPIVLNFAPTTNVVLYTLVICILSGLVFGSLPALRLSRLNVQEELKDGTVDTGRTRFTFLRTLVVIQMAACLVLLAAANLCLHALQRVAVSYPGFPNHRILATQLAPALEGYSREQAATFFDKLEDRVRQLRGVGNVSLAEHLPFDPRGSSMTSRVYTSDFQDQTDRDKIGRPVLYNIVGVNYFTSLGIDLMGGRDFTPHDDKDAPQVAIVNEHMAKLFWKGGDPIGKSFTATSPSNSVIRVIGIARAGKYDSAKGIPQPYFYLPAVQTHYTRMNLLIQTDSDPAQWRPAVQEIIYDLDPQLPVLSSQTLSEHLGLVLFLPKVTSVVFGFFGGLAFILAVMGLYAVVDYSTTQRTREIGIRMALGATSGDVLKLVMRQGFLIAAVGVVVGVLPAFICIRILSRVFYGLGSTNPGALLAAALTLLVIATVASYLPARRAALVHPMTALRYE